MHDNGDRNMYRCHSDRREKCANPPMTWAGSDRRKRLPPGWSSMIQPRILARDGCRCYVCGGPATEVDHVVAGDDHRDSNLAAICIEDHKRKTAAEANAARWKYRMARPRESHPGLR